MKCALCGADTLVKETRAVHERLVRRRLECFNGHRFSTYELHQGLYGHVASKLRKRLFNRRRDLLSRAECAQRNLQIRRQASAGTPAPKLAQMHGLALSSIRRILRTGANR